MDDYYISKYFHECHEVKRVCERYGYGNVMEWASALWRREMRERGQPEDGCFVPVCPSFIEPEHQNPKQHELYDRLIDQILGGTDG